jgi:predicted ester cyclase
VSDRKALVRRLVDEAMNGNNLEILDEPDWHQELIELVAEDSTVVARFRCAGTHHGVWQGLQPTARTMRIDEGYFFRFADDRISGMWGLEDTWTRMRQLAGDDATLGELGSLS